MAKEIEAFIEATQQLTVLKQTIQNQKDTGTKLQAVYESFGRIADEVGKLPLKLKSILDKADAAAQDISNACIKIESLTEAVPDIVAQIENSDIGRSVAALTIEMAANRVELSKFSEFSKRLEIALDTQAKQQAEWHIQLSTALTDQSDRVVEFESRLGLGIEKLTQTQALMIKNSEAFETRQSGFNDAMVQAIAAVRTKQSDSEKILSKSISSVQKIHGTVLEKISGTYTEIAKSTNGTSASLASVRHQEIDMLEKLMTTMSEQAISLKKIEEKKTSLF